jgi:hypothetical protein
MIARWCNPAVAVALAFAALARAAPAPPPADPIKAFEAQYGGRIAAATASPEAADDLALAAELLAAVIAPETEPDLLPLLCHNAYDLAAKHVKGYRAAIRAMVLLAEKVPAQKNASQDRMLDVYQNRYAKSRGAEKAKAGETLVAAIVYFADDRLDTKDFAGAADLYRRAMPLAANLRNVDHYELKLKLDHAVTRRGFQSQAEKLKAALKEQPDDKAARDELVRIYVVEFDNPAAAARQLDLKADDNAKYVLLAGMSIERLPARALAELGHWYRGLADKSSAQGRRIALVRAKTYYERYLRTNSAASAGRADVTAGLDEVDKVLAKVATTVLKIQILSDARFNALYAKDFPQSANVGADGKGHASSHWGDRLPQNVFGGARSGIAWSLNGPRGWFLAKWEPPVRGRYILVFGRNGKPGTDPWGNAAVAVNGNRPNKIDAMSSGKTMIVDLGLVVPITTVRLTVSGTTYPGLAGIEIHPSRRPAARESLTPPAAPAE